MLRPEVGNRCRYQTEITAGIVDAQIKAVAVMVDIVLDVGTALQHQSPAAIGPVGRQVTHLARGVAVTREQHVSTTAGAMHMDPKSLVFFLVEQRMLLLPQGMLPELVGALR